MHEISIMRGWWGGWDNENREMHGIFTLIKSIKSLNTAQVPGIGLGPGNVNVTTPFLFPARFKGKEKRNAGGEDRRLYRVLCAYATPCTNI